MNQPITLSEDRLRAILAEFKLDLVAEPHEIGAVCV